MPPSTIPSPSSATSSPGRRFGSSDQRRWRNGAAQPTRHDDSPRSCISARTLNLTVPIELFPIANLFCRGHRPRLDISSSNFPHFDVNPNSGEPEGAWEQPRIARNRVFVEDARPSHILLPVIPPSERRPAQCWLIDICPAERQDIPAIN